MHLFSLENDLKDLERDLGSKINVELLNMVLAREPSLLHVSSWVEVKSAMRARGMNDPFSERVIRQILDCQENNPSPGYMEALLYVFWSDLVTLYWRCWSWDGDKRARWSSVYWSFQELIVSGAPRSFDGPLVARMMGRTRDKVRSQYRRNWSVANREELSSGEMCSDLSYPAFAVNADAELRTSQMEVVNHTIRKEHERGRITSVQADIIKNVDVGGQSLKSVAKAKGLGYEAAKKARQRALKVLWPALKKALHRK